MSKIVRNWRNWKEPQAPSGHKEPRHPNIMGGGVKADSDFTTLKDKIQAHSTNNVTRVAKKSFKQTKSAKPSFNMTSTMKNQLKDMTKRSQEKKIAQFEDHVKWSEGVQRDLTHKTNQNRVVSMLNTVEITKNKRLASSLAIMISKLAEDMIGEPVIGDDEWDFDELLNRSFTKRNINHCKQSREMDKIVISLDTSPSCRHLSKFYTTIAHLSCKLGLVDIYASPNGFVTHMFNSRTMKYEPIFDIEKDQDYIKAGLQTLDKFFHNRAIIHFSDCDGYEYIIDSSANNTMHWFSCDYVDSKYYARRRPHWRGTLYSVDDEESFLTTIRKMR